MNATAPLNFSQSLPSIGRKNTKPLTRQGTTSSLRHLNSGKSNLKIGNINNERSVRDKAASRGSDAMDLVDESDERIIMNPLSTGIM